MTLPLNRRSMSHSGLFEQTPPKLHTTFQWYSFFRKGVTLFKIFFFYSFFFFFFFGGGGGGVRGGLWVTGTETGKKEMNKPRHEKAFFGVSNRSLHKPGCTTTKDS